jgi:methionine biosynthesis protein MetW
MQAPVSKPDHRAILEFVNEGANVLDLGCGNGDLLALLADQKRVRGHGIEIDEQAIYNCVEKGLNVFHGDIDSGLAEYQDTSFDYVILNQSLQQIQHFDKVFKDALRVGKKIIVGFPNFAHYKSRAQLFFAGRAPVTQSLPYAWYETPNIHFFSITDFLVYCREQHVKTERAVYLDGAARVYLLPNFRANVGIFLLNKK